MTAPRREAQAAGRVRPPTGPNPRPPGSYRHDPQGVLGAVFTPNSQDLLTWDSDGVLPEWDACTDCQNPRVLLAVAVTRVTRQSDPPEQRTFRGQLAKPPPETLALIE